MVKGINGYLHHIFDGHHPKLVPQEEPAAVGNDSAEDDGGDGGGDGDSADDGGSDNSNQVGWTGRE